MRILTGEKKLILLTQKVAFLLVYNEEVNCHNNQKLGIHSNSTQTD